ncbi:MULTISPECIES: DMT family transporter [unclassified Roseitalea]|uniref:DMT family transporter n=1 Tax=unclassified Roseitalea TaxID=2639107 RepID=UPI00273ED5F5|nr:MULTISPECIES: DMT family transporter [unclassified Roseitalea]
MSATVIEQNNMRAIGLMVLSMAMFAVEDMLIKLTTATLGVGQIMLVLAVFGAAAFSLMAWRSGTKLLTRDLLDRAVMVRNLGEIVGTIGFVTALALVPISVASAILQATPLAVTMGAAIFLREPVGWRRWTAIIVGFAGVMLIIRPGFAGFDANALFAVIGVAGLAARDLATRALPAAITSAQVSAYAYWALIPPALVLMMLDGGWRPVEGAAIAYLCAAVVIGVFAYYILTHAIRIGDLSVIAPFRYSRLLFALLVGFFVFAERPDLPVLAGSALVIATGVYALYRERVRKGRIETA